jgi:hypothetical protein
MDYSLLILRISRLYEMLLEAQAAGECQGEHTIAHVGADGSEHTLYAHIDGNMLELFGEPGNQTDLHLSGGIRKE